MESGARAELVVREEPTVPRNYLPAETAGIGSIIPNTGEALPIRTAPQRTGLAERRGVIRSRSGSKVRGNRLTARGEPYPATARLAQVTGLAERG